MQRSPAVCAIMSAQTHRCVNSEAYAGKTTPLLLLLLDLLVLLLVLVLLLLLSATTLSACGHDKQRCHATALIIARPANTLRVPLQPNQITMWGVVRALPICAQVVATACVISDPRFPQLCGFENRINRIGRQLLYPYQSAQKRASGISLRRFWLGLQVREKCREQQSCIPATKVLGSLTPRKGTHLQFQTHTGSNQVLRNVRTTCPNHWCRHYGFTAILICRYASHNLQPNVSKSKAGNYVCQLRVRPMQFFAHHR